MSLSVCCLTADPADRVVASLSLVREVADEIVVAVDDRIDPADLGAYGAVADRVIRFEYASPTERALAWLHDQCSADWILRFDGDEVPGADLIGALPELTASASLRQYFLPRRWVYPDRSHWLDELPWSPDFHNRLLRNEPGALRFPGTAHSVAVRVDPVGIVNLPFYDLGCIVTPRETRESKAAERADPGFRRVAPGGGDADVVFYQPERHARSRGVEIPAADGALIARVLDAQPVASPTRTAHPVARAGRAEIDRLWACRPFADEAYAARISVVHTPRPLPARSVLQFLVEVENLGNEVWDWGFDLPNPVTVSYRWRTTAGTLVSDEALPSALPHALEPGRSCHVLTTVATPDLAGTYTLELDLLHQGHRWFGCGVEQTLEITSGRRP